MTFQSTVYVNLGFGVPGDILFDAPQRCESLTVNSSGVPNYVGYAYTKSATTNIATVGGTVGAGIVFAGIMVHSKNQTLSGTTAGTLTPTLQVPDQRIASFLK
ncbi:MAG: hypothetical protein KGL35_24570, partial [Bradyrhizobium sp.]|nr:hypothetical protein [Bradyrhizobium sp.]